ncbi:hypothetical protein AMS68_000516 [Peltaster fructicola]|uniref:Uncharacterized protein n=1 Tax=Peltaster fructicola TaxID=286661 RepID=A0A6H0XK36_9PEZI|nr:hypothetical protein AMS68_000516 [Peltaster fructicola]
MSTDAVRKAILPHLRTPFAILLTPLSFNFASPHILRTIVTMPPKTPLLESRHSTTRYSAAELKAVGERCSPELPPAVILQLMFVYENKRQAENEKLFNHHMLCLARLEHDNSSHKAAFDKQEKAIKSLEQTVASSALTHKDFSIKTKLEAINERVNELERRSAASEDVITSFQKCINQVTILLASLNTDKGTGSTSTASTTSYGTLADRVVNSRSPSTHSSTLVNARDDRIATFEERFDKLQDPVRCLTQQQAVNENKPSQPIARLQVTTPGLPLDLAIPQGSPLVQHKENRSTTKRAESKGDFATWESDALLSDEYTGFGAEW